MQVALLYHRLLACALRTSLFFESLPNNGASYRQNCVSPEELNNMSNSSLLGFKSFSLLSYLPQSDWDRRLAQPWNQADVTSRN